MEEILGQYQKGLELVLMDDNLIYQVRRYPHLFMQRALLEILSCYLRVYVLVFNQGMIFVCCVSLTNKLMLL